jgi:hypothetical protein
VCRACCVGVCFLGCAVSEYDAEYAKSLQTFRDASEFALLQGDNTVLTPELGVRLPEGFAKATSQPALIRPSDGPGYLATFARAVSIEGRQTLVPLVVAMPTNLKTIDIEEAMTVKARQIPEFASQSLRWETREISPLAGGPSVWRVLSFRGSMPFLTQDKMTGVTLSRPVCGSTGSPLTASRRCASCFLGNCPTPPIGRSEFQWARSRRSSYAQPHTESSRRRLLLNQPPLNPTQNNDLPHR